MTAGMYVKPRLRQSFLIAKIPPATVFLLNEHRQFVFEGEIYNRLIALLDGHATVAEIHARLESDFSLEEVFVAVRRMARNGCLAEGDGPDVPVHGEFWDYLGVESAQVARNATSVSIHTIGDTQKEGLLLSDSLTASGLSVSENAGCRVVVVDDYLHPELEELARSAHAAGPWCLVKPVGMVVWVGPFIVPGYTACWKCLEQRLLANRHVESYIRNRTEGSEFNTAKSRLASATGIGVGFAATEITRFLVQRDDARLGGRLLTMDLLTLEVTDHVLVKRPQCPTCGHFENSVASGPIQLKSSEKIGDHSRTSTLEETFERYKHHLSPITGIVTSFRSREVHEFGVTHNYVAGHHFPVIGNDLQMLTVNMIARSGGKGTSDIEAKTSALCECLERYSGLSWGDEPTVKASFEELRPEAIHPRELLLFSETQYRNRETWNAESPSVHHHVPEQLNDDDEISWCTAWSLTDQSRRYVPASYAYYGHRDSGHDFCRSDSNGCAAGNTIEEAIVHGFLELVERDSVAIWWYNRLARPEVDVESFELPYWRKMKSYYATELGRDLHVLDITADLGVPVFAVVSRRLDRNVEDILLGFGSHLDPRTALMRALGEANQYLPALRHEAEDGSTVYQFNPGEMIDWWKTATYSNQPYLLPNANCPRKTLSDFRSLNTDDVLSDVLNCIEITKSRGLQLIVLDQSRPDVGLPVVRVMIPGLRHFWRRLGPGRLYDVPVELGWLEEHPSEGQMNPISCFV